MAHVAMGSCGEAEEDGSMHAAEKIKEEEMQVSRVQEWWGLEPDGPAVARNSPVLAVLEANLVAEIIAAGGSYHNILSADRLDGLHRQLGQSTDPALEPLRKALQARGGSKSQARAVGMLLFNEARALCMQSKHDSVQPPHAISSLSTPARSPAQQPAPPAAVRCEEVYATAQRYVCSEAYPAGALMAARAAPDAKSEVVAKLPSDFEYLVTGRIGDFLEVPVELNGARVTTYVPHTLGGQVLLVPAVAPMEALEEVWTPPRRWVRAEGFPEGAQMAVKAGPSQQSAQLATLPGDTEYLATGRIREFLQVNLEIDGTAVVAYVLHSLNGMVLLKPAPTAVALPSSSTERSMDVGQAHGSPQQQQQQRALEAAAAAHVAAAAATTAAAAAKAATDDRVEALENKVAHQDLQIKTLQSEIKQMRAQLAIAASALAVAATAPATPSA